MFRTASRLSNPFQKTVRSNQQKALKLNWNVKNSCSRRAAMLTDAVDSHFIRFTCVIHKHWHLNEIAMPNKSLQQIHFETGVNIKKKRNSTLYSAQNLDEG